MTFRGRYCVRNSYVGGLSPVTKVPDCEWVCPLTNALVTANV